MSTPILRNRYKILRRLGAGGVGSVYMVEELHSGSRDRPPLALKALFTDSPKTSLLFSLQQEFRVLATLRHPLLARVHDFGSIPPSSGLPGSAGQPGYFFTRDLIEGEDLEAHCQGLSVARICQVCQETAQVLDVLHRAGMIHGDFKPANVIVSRDGRPHLIDFGLVRSEGQSSMAAGTAAYFPPELLRGNPIDRRGDLYSLGISIYQLLTKHLPVKEENPSLGRLISWHLDGAPVRVSPELEVPAILDRILERLTQRDPDQRFPSAAEVAMALAEAATEAGGSPAPPPPRVFIPPAPGENLTAPLLELETAVRDSTLGGAGTSSLLVVEGEPGAGKTTLLRELSWRSQLAGVEVIRARYRAEDPRPLGAWIDLLEEVAGVVGLPHPLDGKISTEVDRYALFQEISDYLSRCAKETPLLLLLDQVEQADVEDRAALRFVAHTIAPSDPALIVAAIPGDEALYQDLGAPPRHRLDPLSTEDTRRMIADASGRRDDDLGQRIQNHTGGNPAFVMEVLRRLGEAGWPASPDLQALAPPRGLEDMYTGQWQKLEPGEQLVLDTMAVLGRPVTGRRLLEVTGALSRSGSHVGLPLEQLDEMGWLDRSPDGAYSFRQDPAARIIHDQLPEARRREIHRAAASVLERDGMEDAVQWTWHAVGAGQLTPTLLDRLGRVVETLRSLGAHRKVIHLYSEMIPLAGQDTDLLGTIHRELGESFHQVGDYDRAIDELEQACSHAEGQELNHAAISQAQVYRSAGQAERSLDLLALIMERASTSSEQVAALSEAAAAHRDLDAHEAVLETVAKALGIIEQEESRGVEPDLVQRAELRGRMAVSLSYLQRYEQAAGEFEIALQDARTSGNRGVEGKILNGLAIMAFRQADFSEVSNRYSAAMECAREIGDVEKLAAIQLNLAALHLMRGEYAACLRHLPEGLRLAEAMGAHKSLADARCNMGYVQLRLGLYEQARATLRKAILETRQVGRRSGEALAVLLLALVQARRSNLEEARAGIAAAREIYLDVGQRRDAADGLLDLAAVELEAGHLARSQRALDQASGEVDLDQIPDLNVRGATLRARILAVNGSDAQRTEVARALTLAFEEAEKLDAPELIWECHAAAMALAEASGQPGKAASHAAAAADILESMAVDLPPEVQAAFYQDPRRRDIRGRVAIHRTVEGVTMGQKDEALPAGTFASNSGMGGDLTLPMLSETLGGSGLTTTSVGERYYRLLEIYRQINSELDHDRLLGLVMDTAVELTGAERGFLLLGKSPQELNIEVARNLDLEGEKGAYSRSIAEQVFSSGHPVITISARNDPRFEAYLSVHQLQLESVLCIPIHARGQTSGVLYMESRFQSGRFTPEDQRLLMAFGDQVAIALTNARLLADNIRKARELEQAKKEIEALAEERGRLLNQRTLQLEEARRDLAETRRQLDSRGMFGMVGRSQAMTRLFALVERVASADVPVLVEGESGTGKEMVARAIHTTSNRSKGRLVSVNCAAIPENLLESELFGHVRGAFTGADRERKGLFSTAHGGTLFLDEIGDMPARMQVDLLRALQEKTIRPVGAQEDIKVDVRVIAASNKPLASLIQRGEFREDLYYRLNVVTLKIPPLRDRMDDIPLLVDHFLLAIAEQMKMEKKHVTRQAMQRLMECTWPGNVRQLEHTLMNASVLADGDVLDTADFTIEAPISQPAMPDPVTPPPIVQTRKDRKNLEKQRIVETLESCNWNKSQAAKRLNIPRRTFYRRLKEFDLM